MTTSPLRRAQTPHAAQTNFCMEGPLPDAVNLAEFYLHRFRGFGAPGVRKSPSPIDLSHRPYKSVTH